MRSWIRRLLYLAAGLAALVVLTVIGGGLYVRKQLHASLPVLDGVVQLRGLAATVTIARDGLGVPSIAAASRRDAARALGFLHAQERFFQMDLQRRQSAGELAALVGARAVEVDRQARVHRFRTVARAAVERATSDYRGVLEAYADGVNAGLNGLGAPPFEYLLLRATPEPWRPEDTVLTVLAMFNTLQGRQAAFEGTFGSLADAVPPAMYEFLTARGSEWDAPLTGGRFPRPAIPGPDVFNLRRAEETAAAPHNPRPYANANLRPHAGDIRPHLGGWMTPLSDEEAAGLGSNNWAVAGAQTSSGVALIANDMHLAINVPNIWYRASMTFPDERRAGESLTLSGVTLPGLPALVVGSNGHVAWGFTNSGGDWSDLIVVERDARDRNTYLTPSGPQPFERHVETIAMSGGGSTTVVVESTIWGPVIRTDAKGRPIVQRWVAHDAGALAADMTGPEAARTVDEALRVAAGLGMPAQNFVAGDRDGNIGWTIAGPIPRREGFDGSRPMSWSDGSRRWNGYLAADRYPRVVNPEDGRIWTANAPVVEGEMLATLGDGGYADGIRARIIRDRLRGIDKAREADMLAVQLDDSALFHERWRRLLLETLTPAAMQGDARRAEFRQLVETSWTGRAEPASVGYRLVRTFRQIVGREVFGAIAEPIRRIEPEFDYGRAQRSEGPLWQLVTERPLHLLHPKHASWDAQLLAAVDLTIAELTTANRSLAERSWGEFNQAVVTHPLGNAVPLAGRWLNMPSDPLPGDIYTPRAHSPRAGPSERLVVSPGRERDGILHMPGGQSGHLLSPHYADQHQAWVAGRPLPLLPGPAVSKLTLTP